MIAELFLGVALSVAAESEFTEICYFTRFDLDNSSNFGADLTFVFDNNNNFFNFFYFRTTFKFSFSHSLCRTKLNAKEHHLLQCQKLVH